MTNELPKILQGKLEFGNKEQIDALKEYYDKLEKNEENIEAGLKKFKVKIHYRGTEILEVWARDKSHAYDVAGEKADEPWDWEIKDIDIIEEVTCRRKLKQ